MSIKFGTDGWRAVMAEDFTFENVEIVAQGIAEYLREHHSDIPGEGIVIGYDNRFLSPEFAQRAAEVMAGNGIYVYMSEKSLPTPTTAYAIINLQTKGALMFTASHNPPQYNGVKFIPYYGGPALPELTKKLEQKVAQVQKTKEINKISYKQGTNENCISTFELKSKFLSQLKNLVDIDTIKNSNLKIAVDAMYGVGAGYLDKLLTDLGCQVDAICDYRDPLFGGKMPEPSPEVLQELIAMVKEGDYDLGLALDGDADRFGIVDHDGTFINANQILSIVYLYLLKRGDTGPVTKTVSTTQMLNRIAEIYGEEVFETPVGFKYIGKNLKDEGCLLGGEESGGLSIKGHIPEKDGILACLLVVEVLARTELNLGELLTDMEEKYGQLVNERLDIHTSEQDKSRVLKYIDNWRPETLADKSVKGFSTTDGLKISCEDGSWVLIRPSGTEPLFRIYGETSSWEDLKSIQTEVREKLEI